MSCVVVGVVIDVEVIFFCILCVGVSFVHNYSWYALLFVVCDRGVVDVFGGVS